jgi:hypothetical protein
MKTLTALSVSIVAIVSSYMSVDGSFAAVSKNDSMHDKTDIIIASQCPDDRNVIYRNLRKEGVVSKIKAQSVDRSQVAEIKNRP